MNLVIDTNWALDLLLFDEPAAASVRALAPRSRPRADRSATGPAGPPRRPRMDSGRAPDVA